MPIFDITLPSRGILYEDKLPGGKIKVSSMTAKEQAIIFNAGAEPMTKIDGVIKNCIKECPIPVNTLLITDRVYTMLVLRIRSYPTGNIYEVPMRCGSCNTQYKHKVDLLKDLTTQIYSNTPENPEGDCIYIDPDTIKEPFHFIAPMSGDEIEYRLLRGYDETKIAAHSKRFLMQSSDIADPSFTQRLSLMIQKINGKDLSEQDKFMYVQNMEAGDVQELNDDAEYNESGTSLMIETVCNKCGYTEEVGMPFTADFFRPSARKTRRRR